jgi:hypothetical protein
MMTECLRPVDGWTQGWCDVPMVEKVGVEQDLVDEEEKSIKKLDQRQ